MSADGGIPSNDRPFQANSSFVNSLMEVAVFVHDHITKQQIARLLESRLKANWKEMIMQWLTHGQVFKLQSWTEYIGKTTKNGIFLVATSN